MMKFISSNGGAYLVMAQAHLSKWPGATDMKVYDSMPFDSFKKIESLTFTWNNKCV